MGMTRDVVERFYERFATWRDGSKELIPAIYTPLGPVAASGKELDLLFVDYFRVANEKIVECKVVRDRLGMLIQLGAVPQTNS